MPRETLIKFLDQPNPFLDIRISKPSGVMDKDLPYIPTATEWVLTFDYIKHTFGFLLYKEFDFPDHFTDLHDTQKIVFDEDTFRRLVIRWNLNIVGIAVRVVSEALAHVPEFPDICIAAGSSGISSETDMPDFAVLPADTPAGMQHTCLAPGVVKVTRKHYNSFKPVDDTSNNWARKYLAEMSRYADTRGTRYFWCITPVELMVCRRPTSLSPGVIVPEVATFDWVPGPHQGVSVNLALFFLVLAAGLGNDVHATYKDISIEHREKLEKIKAAVDAL